MDFAHKGLWHTHKAPVSADARLQGRGSSPDEEIIAAPSNRFHHQVAMSQRTQPVRCARYARTSTPEPQARA